MMMMTTTMMMTTHMTMMKDAFCKGKKDCGLYGIRAAQRKGRNEICVISVTSSTTKFVPCRPAVQSISHFYTVSLKV